MIEFCSVICIVEELDVVILMVSYGFVCLRCEFNDWIVINIKEGLVFIIFVIIFNSYFLFVVNLIDNVIVVGKNSDLV